MTNLHKWTYSIIVIILVALLGVLGYLYFSQEKITEIEEIDLTTPELNESTYFPKPSDENLGEEKYDHRGELRDVTDGSIRQTQFAGDATGFAQSGYLNESYGLIVTFENLPEPTNDEFYEGWIVRKTPFNFVSTGELTMENGKYVNRFENSDDLRDHSQYVLTIEPNDDNPTPDAHVLEGIMNKVIE